MAQIEAIIAALGKVYGPNSAWVARVRESLARLLFAQKDYQAAELELREALVVFHATRGARAPIVRQTRQFLADVLRQSGDQRLQKGDLPGAQSRLRESWTISEDLNVQQGRRARATLRLLTKSLLAERKFDKAQKILLANYDALTAAGANEKSVRDALTLLIELYASWDKPQRADEYRRLRNDLSPAPGAKP